MNTIKFYKNITTGLWHVDNDIVPSGSLRLKIVHDGMINLLTSEGRSYFDLGVLVTNIIKENGEPYESLSDFIAANKDFFVNAAQVAADDVLALSGRVETLEEHAYDTLWIDYWQVGVPAIVNDKYWFDTVHSIYYCNGIDWVEIYGDNTISLSQNKIYIKRSDNTTYAWSGSVMVASSTPLIFASQAEAEAGIEDSKIMTALRVMQNFVYNIVNKTFAGFNTVAKTVQGAINELLTKLDTKQTVFTGICQEQYLTENDIEIDTVNFKFKINTVKGGTTINSTNPICFYTDGNGVSTKHTLSTPQEVAFTNTTGIWYFYFNSSAQLIATQSAWSDFSNIAAVYRIYWNATLYRFTVTSANATMGATYTNNGVTYTVLETIAAGTSLKMSGSGLPLVSGTLTKASGTGDNTITFSAYSFVDRNVVESVEYHKNDVSWVDHAWKHAQGTVWVNGGEIVSNLITNSNGVPTSPPNIDGRNTVVSLTSLSCIDDNLLYTVTNSTNNTKFHQDLGNTTAASLTLSNSAMFKIRTNDSNGLLQFLPATRFPFPWDVATNSPQCITATGVRTLIADNRWFVTYIYSLQDPRVGEAVKVISEVSEFTSYVNAQASSWENLKALYPTLRDNEIRPFYRLIYYCDKSGGGSYNAAVKYSALVKIDDIRTFRTASVSTVSGTVLASSVLVTPPTGILATNQQSFDVEIADMFYGRNITLTAYDLDLSIGENFTKVYADGNSFTLSNPTIGKKFRLFLSGGTTLTTPTFYIPAGAAYTTTWMASTLAADYNGTANVLYCEIRSAGTLNLFWGE